MKYLLDTSTCVFVLRGHQGVVERLAAVPSKDVAVSVITVAELRLGARKSRQPALTQMGVDILLQPLGVFPFDLPEFESYVDARYPSLPASRSGNGI